VFYGIRSERQLIEQLDYNLLYRWFVGLAPDDPVWDAMTSSKNRARLELARLPKVNEPSESRRASPRCVATV
jgi:transposase